MLLMKSEKRTAFLFTRIRELRTTNLFFFLIKSRSSIRPKRLGQIKVKILLK